MTFDPKDGTLLAKARGLAAYRAADGAIFLVSSEGMFDVLEGDVLSIDYGGMGSAIGIVSSDAIRERNGRTTIVASDNVDTYVSDDDPRSPADDMETVLEAAARAAHAELRR